MGQKIQGVSAMTKVRTPTPEAHEETKEKKEKSPKVYAKVLAERLRIARNRLDPIPSQRHVAYTLKKAPASVSLWEAGTTEPSIDSLVALAKWYNVSLDWLVGLNEDPKTKMPNFPSLHVVPVAPIGTLLSWDVDECREYIQTSLDYHKAKACGIRHEGRGAMPGVALDGDIVVTLKHDKDSPLVDDAVYYIIEAKTNSSPVMRKCIKDGSQHLFVAEHQRWPVLDSADVTVLGRVCEVIRRRVI